jgi:beta-1,4-mannosyl-glycoprotein beta-1,4-N-acetylglucosaminyltransferase
MILDCFTFFNEVELLEGRLEYLYDTVDYFIIVECNITHRGNPKPLNYLNNIQRYKKYLDKIIYFPYAADIKDLNVDQTLTDFDYNSAHWKIEKRQRNHILEAVKFFKEDDMVLISDLDEIPSKSAINIASKQLGTAAAAFSLSQDFFFYNFSQKQSYPWKGTVISTNKFVQEQSPQWLRDMRWDIPTIFQGGYHLSYWGDPSRIATKIQNFAHQELNKETFTDTERIKERIKSGNDPFDRQQLIPVVPESISTDIYSIFAKYGSS